MAKTDINIEEQYQQLRGKMLHLASLLLKDEAAAEDAVGEVFLKILSSPPVNIQNMEGFMLTATRNRCITILRTRQRRGNTEYNKTKAEAIPSEPPPEDDDRLQRIERYINENMPERTRQVLSLRFKEKRKYAEIATDLHISQAAVYKHLAQGLERLKKEFNP